MSRRALVAGGGGFIGGHLVQDLLRRGLEVRVADIKPLSRWYQIDARAENLQLDLSKLEACMQATQGVQEVYNLACDMGGMGFIEGNKALCMLSSLTNTHLLLGSRNHAVERFFYASTACVYAADKQDSAAARPLVESDAYPAMPEDGYGWEKLFGERMARHFMEDFGLATRVARLHNVYGPHGTYDGGREKAPAALCRKVIQAKLSGDHRIEIWGDGEQTRSFTFIDDCIHGIGLIMNSDFEEPLNLGSETLVSINELVTLIEGIAGVELERSYKLDAPLGVRGRNSENTLIRKVLGWAPGVELSDGIEPTYRWIWDQINGRDARGSRGAVFRT
jgi:nucleoside-diphosphate-sugar epimerase